MQPSEKEQMLALRGGLRGRFQNSFHLLENAFEVLEDQMEHCVTPTEYEELRPLLRQISERLLLLRRLGEHAADAAIAPVLQQVCMPHPIELLGQLREMAALFNEIAAQEQVQANATVEAKDGLPMLLTMGDSTLLNGLLANLFSNSLAAKRPVHITLACGPESFCYHDDGPGLSSDAKELLKGGVWSERLLEQGGLGLPLIRAYAAAMGWSLVVEEAAGMTLRFVLPPCAVDLDHMVLESNTAPQVQRDRRRDYFRRELQSVLPERAEE